MATMRIAHNLRRQCFVATDAAAAELGYLEYEPLSLQGQKVLDLAHTVVLPAARGMGLAQKLCDAAFDYAKENGFKVRPTCSYISQTYLVRTQRPDVASLVHQGPDASL
ncbi:hypothetical protein SDRG_00625 [Saprolegnia diclina VS20]|uniref:N-acetyltransferase domain-containing protein n=1 Tax=Saprolegnia diclina (strain VS20) TaxID=1156394 RepID=T0SFJ9_SAPDV|nr:hypothetical protein SDRG_00625 [Saprolegnia diclina VS20]EQC41762.1 hypothetical protein SDRG_00625 [Saprolegnia diclina VS20]|eukprot:XP_008604331.1 hypothetical protein SDRG_00625 [Saprolegnia diclina VS20]